MAFLSPKVTVKIDPQTQTFLTRIVDRVCKSLDNATAAAKAKTVKVNIDIK